MRRPAVRTAGVLLITASLGVAGCKLDSMVFGGEETDSYVLPPTVVPDSLRKEVTFPSDGETLHGYWLRQPGSAPRLTVVYSHGKGAHLAGDVPWTHAEFLWQSGLDVLTYDYRGFGRSTGTSEDELTIAADARGALAYALAQPGVTIGRVVSYGHSLGSSPAITLAATVPGMRALVVEAGFSNGQAMAETADPLDFPVSWLLRQPMANLDHMKLVTAPVLIMHGDHDLKIPVAQAHDLYNAARDPKQLRIVVGGDHNYLPSTLGLAAFSTLLRGFTNAASP